MNKNTKKYWNGFFKGDRFIKRHCWRIKPYQGIASVFDFKKLSNKKIIDVGCAFGDGLEYIRKISPNNQYKGIDYVEECIDWAKEKNKDVDFELKNIHKFNEKADVIMIVETLEHLNKDKEVLKKLKKLSDTLIISVPNDEVGNRGGLIDLHVNNYTKESFKGAKVYEVNNYLIAIYE